MTVFEQLYQLVGSTEVDMYKMSVIEHISLIIMSSHSDFIFKICCVSSCDVVST